MSIQIILSDEPDAVELQRCKKCGSLLDSVYHVNLCPQVGAPLPDPSLGSNLNTIEDVRRWLGHPSNQFDTWIFIIEWTGHVPRIRSHDVERLWENTSMAEAIIYEQRRRKQHFKEEPRYIGEE